MQSLPLLAATKRRVFAFGFLLSFASLYGACTSGNAPEVTHHVEKELSERSKPFQETSEQVRIVFLGDSLTDGYGVEPQDAYPSLLEKKLIEDGYTGIQIINSSISGSTSASAMGRLKWQLKAQPNILFLALGANDGLRGLELKKTRENLSAVIQFAQKEGLQVILAGMKLPPNYGSEYVKDFERMYVELSKAHGTHLVPFLLEGVGGEPEMNQADGIHPNEVGHRKMAETVYPYLEKLIKKLQKPDQEK